MSLDVGMQLSNSGARFARLQIRREPLVKRTPESEETSAEDSGTIVAGHQRSYESPANDGDSKT